MRIGVKGREHALFMIRWGFTTHTNEGMSLAIRHTCSDDHRESTRNVFEEHVAKETSSLFCLCVLFGEKTDLLRILVMILHKMGFQKHEREGSGKVLSRVRN